MPNSGWTLAIALTMTTADIVSTDLELINSVQPNLLMCGPVAAVDTALAILRPSLQQPVYIWVHDAHLSLPQQLTGTLILEDATTLDDEEQSSLLDWLNEPERHVQVISTTGKSLFPLMQHGAFLDSLYYRLNTLQLDLGCPN